jgi:hypothetical protein
MVKSRPLPVHKKLLNESYLGVQGSVVWSPAVHLNYLSSGDPW